MVMVRIDGGSDGGSVVYYYQLSPALNTTSPLAERPSSRFKWYLSFTQLCVDIKLPKKLVSLAPTHQGWAGRSIFQWGGARTKIRGRGEGENPQGRAKKCINCYGDTRISNSCCSSSSQKPRVQWILKTESGIIDPLVSKQPGKKLQIKRRRR